jgi:transcriptional regulator with XRE-family HTH domain
MEQMGINKAQLAEMLDCSPSSVTKYLSGTHNFTINTLEAIQKALYINFFHYTEQQIPCFPCEVKPFMNKKELYSKLNQIPGITINDWLPIMRFQILYKVNNIENIPIEHRFGRIIYNLDNKPVLTNGSEPYLYLDYVTIEDLKRDWKASGMSQESLDEFDYYELKPVVLNIVENDNGAG